MNVRASVLLTAAATVVAAVLVVACSDGRTVPPGAARIGDPDRGAEAIEELGCGACHTIPGIPGADAHVGPPLTDWSRRSYIAGALPNTADNLVAWIVDPDAIEPGTAMPDLGVPPLVARDIAAYLFTLD